MKDSFYTLSPEIVLNAAEAAGFAPTGEFTQLNSYENRVFDIRLESMETPRVIAKFYRPGRWSMEAILEEHYFLFELAQEEIPVVSPLIQKNKSSLQTINGMHVAFFPKFMGKMPDELFDRDFYKIGRQLAQIHNVGARNQFRHRPVLGMSPASPWDNLELLSKWVAPELWPRYEQAVIQIIDGFESSFDSRSFIRIHGDCHRGNLLSAGKLENFHFVDFDDCCMGPEIQDFWMLFTSEEKSNESELIFKGYSDLRDFPAEQFEAIPFLRGFRIFSYAAWIARRWQDPSFPKLFPEFNTYNYWAQETEALEKISLRSF